MPKVELELTDSWSSGQQLIHYTELPLLFSIFPFLEMGVRGGAKKLLSMESGYREFEQKLIIWTPFGCISFLTTSVALVWLPLVGPGGESTLVLLISQQLSKISIMLFHLNWLRELGEGDTVLQFFYFFL
uniref:Uncharacterized protein n=1 Tax=Micrurus lemniscatus lemniscatus TaxID=129467 RepID=A0A2D4JNE5_MICLE